MNRRHGKTIEPGSLRKLGIAMLLAPLVFAFAVTIAAGTSGFALDSKLAESVPLVMSAVALLPIPAASIARRLLFARIAGAPEPRRLMLYVTGTIVSFGLLEAAMLIAILASLLAHALLPGVVPAAIAFVVGAASLPSDEQFAELARPPRDRALS